MPGVGARAQNPAHLGAAEHRQIEVENDQVREVIGHHLQRFVSAADDLRLGLAASLERVFDQPGEILLVFDNEHAVFGHAIQPLTLLAGGFAAVTELLNVS